MFGLFSSKPRPVQSTVAFTLRSAIQLHDRTLEQVQRVTEHYVATEANGRLLLYRADTNERYAVNRGARELKRLDLSAQRAQARQLQALVGEVAAVIGPEEVEVDGYRCRRATFQVETPQMVVSSEMFRARIPGLERTALSAERALDESVQPFRTGLEPDEVIVRSSLQILAAGTGQNQTSRLVSASEGIDELPALDEVLAYKIVD